MDSVRHLRQLLFKHTPTIQKMEYVYQITTLTPPLFVLSFVLQLFPPILFAFASILYFATPFLSPSFGYNPLLFQCCYLGNEKDHVT